MTNRSVNIPLIRRYTKKQAMMNRGDELDTSTGEARSQATRGLESPPAKIPEEPCKSVKQ